MYYTSEESGIFWLSRVIIRDIYVLRPSVSAWRSKMVL